MDDNGEIRHIPGAIRLVTAAEAAEIFRVKKLTIYRWAKQGKLPSWRVGPTGRMLRFAYSDIVALIRQRQAQPEDAKRVGK